MVSCFVFLKEPEHENIMRENYNFKYDVVNMNRHSKVTECITVNNKMRVVYKG